MSREVRNGLTGGFISVSWMILLYFLKQETSGLGILDPYFCIIVLTAFVYITILYKRDRDLGGALTFAQGFRSGIVTAFMMGLVVGIFKLVYVKYINPDIVEQVVEQARSFYEKAGGTPAQIKQAADSARAMYSPFGQFTYGVGIHMLLGAVVALVCSAIMRREKSA